jgi:hypothetical protein
MADIFNDYGVEVYINDDDFLKIKETLSRIGISSSKDKILYQTAHILHRQGRYVIIHFKELFALDGKLHSIEENDIARRNTITNLLEEWDLLEIVNPESTQFPIVPISQIKILAFKDKPNYTLVSKYNIGKIKLG